LLLLDEVLFPDDDANFVTMATDVNESYIIEQYASQVLDFSTQV
jgi:hypothetical protein